MDKINELSKRQNAEEKLLIAKIIDKIKLANGRNKLQNTNFMDLSQQETVKKILEARSDVNYSFDGGFEEAERKVLIIEPYNVNYNKKINNEIMTIIRVTIPKELNGTFEHKTYLGALMKLGLRREKIGDIIVRYDGADIIILKEIENFLIDNLKNLTRFKKSKLEECNLEDLKYVLPKKETFKINVPSMRLDCIVGELARCSRSEANELLEQERVFVNFKEELRGSVQIKEDTFITIRGKGRFKILKITGATRSGRLSVEIEK